MDDPQELSGRRRKRVSRACDRCRSKKDRCDGGRPACQPCQNSGQVCSYDPVSKKRGLPEGYVRGLEKLWALSISNIDGFETSVLTLLGFTDPDSPQRQRLQSLWADENVSEQLHETWKSSELFGELEKLMSSAEVDNAASSTGSADLDTNDLSLGHGPIHTTPNAGCSSGIVGGCPSLTDSAIPNTAGFSLRPKRKRARLDCSIEPNLCHLSLPSDTPQLLETYFRYTHSWFPVIAKHAILRTSHQYSQQPLRIGSTTAGSGDHAALWAILSYVAAQKRPSMGTSTWQQSLFQGPVSQAMEFYTNARNLIPADEEWFELGHVQALLLLTLVKGGLEDWSAAWVLIGQASRQATALQNGVNSSPGSRPAASACNALVLGCFVVDTMLSTRLKKPAHVRPEELRAPLLEEDGLEEWAPWHDASFFSHDQPLTGPAGARNPLLSHSCFNRLVELSAFLGKISQQDPFDITTPTFCQTILKDIQAWCEKLPPVCRLGAMGNKPAEEIPPFLLPHQTYLCLTYLATISFFYTRFASQLQPHFSVLEKALQLGTAILASHTKHFDQAVLPPIFEYSLRAIIDGARLPSTSSEGVRRQHSSWMECIGSYIAKTGRTWPVIRRLLQDVSKTIAPSDRSNSHNDSKPSPQPSPDCEETQQLLGNTLLSIPQTLNEEHGYSHPRPNDSILEFLGLASDLRAVTETNSTSLPASSSQESNHGLVPTIDDLFTPNSATVLPFLDQDNITGSPECQETVSPPMINEETTPDSIYSNSICDKQAHRPSSSSSPCTKRCAPNEIDSIFDDVCASDGPGHPSHQSFTPHRQTSSLGLEASKIQNNIQRKTTPNSERDATSACGSSFDGPGSRDRLLSPRSIGDLWPPPGFFPDEGDAASGERGNRDTETG